VRENKRQQQVTQPEPTSARKTSIGVTRSQLSGASLAAALFEAIRLDRIEVFYQPIVDTSDERVVGAEALLRWNDPVAGMLTAASFTQVAEQSGVLGLLGRRALNIACRAVTTWQIGGDFRLHVNANVQQLSSRPFLTDVRHALRDSGLPPEQLTIEITETARLTATGQVLQNLNALRALGVGVELDDFGTGYCSPLYLKQLPVTGIKLDRQFIAGLGIDRTCDVLVSHLSALGHGLGLNVCAEGVETNGQLDLLRSYNVNRAQGWLFSPAVCSDDFVKLLARRARQKESLRAS
jgi:EAL domain-containing protein (putative c-di-GMP-specific phosphodiesterase class I)